MILFFRVILHFGACADQQFRDGKDPREDVLPDGSAEAVAAAESAPIPLIEGVVEGGQRGREKVASVHDLRKVVYFGSFSFDEELVEIGIRAGFEQILDRFQNGGRSDRI